VRREEKSVIKEERPNGKRLVESEVWPVAILKRSFLSDTYIFRERSAVKVFIGNLPHNAISAISSRTLP